MIKTKEVKIKKTGKKGIFFSADTLIALTIILLIVLLSFPLINQQRIKTNLHQDILTALSSIKMSEVDPSLIPVSVQPLIIPEKTALEQIGELYIQNKTLARELANSMLSDIQTNENLGLWYGNELIWSSNSSNFESAKNINAARQSISGIQNGSGSTGFSARAFLSSSLRNEYFYFGGFVGEGNITARIEYNGTLTGANIELTVNEDFELFINNIFSGSYQKSPSEFTPVKYAIDPQYLVNFNPGENIINFEGQNLRITGGFIKVSYESDLPYQQSKRQNFPGIQGLINVFDGIHFPENTSSLEISLHVNSSEAPVFVAIGNVSVFKGITNDEELITLPNSLLSSLLDYDLLAGKTIPVRIGLENVSFVNASIDLISVSDLSKSMACSVPGGNCGNGPLQCSACGGSWLLPLNTSKQAHTNLVNSILEFGENNRVGIKGYHVSVPTSADHPLSNDSESLISTIDSWDEQTLSSQNRRLCLAMQSAVSDFQASSSPENVRVAIVMSAGEITHGCGITAGDLNINGIADDPQDQAIKVACDAFNNDGIIFHSVGYGEEADESTLQLIAACGGGDYYYSTVDDLISIYETIIEAIILEHQQQTIFASSVENTRLYPDSYIELDYPLPQQTFGLISTSERMFENTTSGEFEVFEDTAILETRLISYSGPKWTAASDINLQQVYNLSEYGSSFTSLGDPFTINIPNELVQTGINKVSLITGVTPQNLSEGSSSNKIIYTTSQNVSSFSPISAFADGCTWHIQFEDNSEIEINIPSDYSGTNPACYYNVTHPTPQYDQNDVFQEAVFRILEKLDLDSNDKVDVLFAGQDLQISLTEVTGIPFAWSTEVQTRAWS